MATRTKQSGTDINLLKAASINSLDRKLELALIKEAQAGNRAAEDKLIRANIRFVLMTAKGYRTPDAEFGDLVSEGIIGLRHAIMEHRNPEIKLISYAVWWIRQHIIKFITTTNMLVRPACNIRLDNNRKRRAELKLMMSYHGKAPRLHNNDFLVTDELHSALSSKHELQGDVSLDAAVSDDESSTRIESFLSESVIENYYAEDEVDIVKNIIVNALKYRKLTYDIFCHSYGVFNYEKLTLAAIASRYSLSRERVRQLQKFAMAKVQQKLVLKGIIKKPLSATEVNKLLRKSPRKAKAKAVDLE